MQLYSLTGDIQMAVYGYTRVSTEQQSEEGISLSAQQRQLEGYAMQHDMALERVYTDRAVSGWKPLDTRPEGGKLLTKLQPGDAIICPKLDRMFRNSNDALSVSEKLRKASVSLHLLDLGGDVTGNGVSKVFFTILAAFAEFERDRIAQRIKDVKRSQRADGEYLGGSIPFGFYLNDKGGLAPDMEQQSKIQKIILLRERGFSLRAISKQLENDGIQISHVSVRRILRDTKDQSS